ncbi:hypothetical protein PIB30_052541 [Stylosanthes scabra]|uniref:RRM domain-containing protein n=1 Tax=Stylosanthes scabra TaxID=79078 RepID=A0ABU6RI76_9FABA|nr:hypothetical protein [Stylosanthes scabra]
MHNYRRDEMSGGARVSGTGKGVDGDEANTNRERADGRLQTMERSSHSIFVDNLPHDVARATLYKIFGWAGSMVDVYVSRKKRKGSSTQFAFVRFNAKGGVIWAVQKLNGVCIRTKRMVVTASDYARYQPWRRDERAEGSRRDAIGGISDNGKHMQWKQMPGRNGDRIIQRTQGDAEDGGTTSGNDRKVIEVEPVLAMQDMLKRSIVVEFVEPIRYRKMMEKVKEDWKGPGGIEGRHGGS